LSTVALALAGAFAGETLESLRRKRTAIALANDSLILFSPERSLHSER
jgi:hypothetical protein